MSAVLGLLHRDGRPVETHQLDRMMAAVAHRGPDGQATWRDGPVGLGHLRLRSTPESVHERLPLADVSGTVVLTADARLDNRAELIGALGLADRPTTTLPDAELVLAAYRRWGDDCPGRLLGDFSFAIWDRARQRLFCARDQVGARPFAYVALDGLFAFGSEAKALLALPEVPRRPDEAQVADFLTGEVDDTAATFYHDIRRLPPGHTLTVERGEVHLRRYWAPDPARELRLPTEGAYVEAFRATFAEAVRCRLRGAPSVGALLSGGLDSSAIAGVGSRLLAELGAGPLPTFSCIFDDVPDADERAYQQLVLGAGDFRPHAMPVDGISPLADAAALVDLAEGPPLGPGLYSQLALYSAARRAGVRALLDGHGGDEVVSHGEGYLSELALAGRWRSLLREARGVARTYGDPLWPLLFGYARYGLSRSAIFRRVWFLGGAVRQQLLSTAGQRGAAATATGIVHPELARRVDLVGRQEARRRAQARAFRSERTLHHRVLVDGRQSLGIELLDRAAASSGIEPRYPFWDRRLVELCLALPPEQKLHDGWSRRILRRAMDGILPPGIQWRVDKTDFSPAIRYGLLRFERERLRQLLLEDAGGVGAYVDLAALRPRLERFLAAGATEVSGDLRDVWAATALALWLHRLHASPARHAQPLDRTVSQGLAAAAHHPAS